jgi:PIN domain nuclease of toxin-antitoxin system
LRYLLDTGVWLWSLLEPERLSRKAQDVITDLEQEIFLSAATSWEIAIKSSQGKLRLLQPAQLLVPQFMREQGLRPLPISLGHTLAVASLPLHHRDPFDRLLIAQALEEKMALLTADRAFEKYGVDMVWCGK